jgi:hypothetical protein
MNNILFILLIVAMLATLATLVAGMVVMSKGGDLNQKWSNKLMRLRVILQGVALVLFALVMMGGNNP